jgi:dockerin type I repeat protein
MYGRIASNLQQTDPGIQTGVNGHITMRRSVRVSTFVVLAVALLCCATAPARAQTIQGDLNNDGFVGALDIQILLDHWSQSVTPGDLSQGDVFPDGFIDTTDLSFLLLNWGQGTIPTPGGDASIGMNLTEVTYYSRAWTFVDAVRTARPWVSTNTNGQPFDTKQTVEVDENGWPDLQPGQAAQTLLLTDKAGAYPEGTYNVAFDGTGTIAFEFDATNVQTPQTLGPGQMSFNVSSASKNGILMRVISNNEGDHITNIRVWMPGYEDPAGEASSFHPTFVERLQPFGVIRFMDWQHTNLKQTTELDVSYDWVDRTTPNDFSQHTRRGVALEYMIELCNELDADAWFCMPHEASDDFVVNFATMVRENLDEDLNVYVEWSNEVWNTQFPQSKWVDEQSGKNIFADEWFWTWAEEAARDFAIWHTVFAGQTGRIKRVAAGQQANVWVTKKLVAAFDNPNPEFGDPLNSPYDAISCAAYFDQWKTQFDGSTTVQDIIDNAINNTIPNVYAGFYQDHGELAQRLTNEQGREIPLLAYEGGQHYTVHGIASKPYYQAFKDVQVYSTPGDTPKDMYDAYTANMQAFDQGGGSLFMAYSYVRKQDKFGFWGHLQYQDQDPEGEDAPKYRALTDFSSD